MTIAVSSTGGLLIVLAILAVVCVLGYYGSRRRSGISPNPIEDRDNSPDRRAGGAEVQGDGSPQSPTQLTH